MSRIVVGVDGGGTTTRAVVLDDSGSELARVSGRGAVASAQDPGPAADATADVVRAALAKAGLEPPAAVLWAGLAGAGRADARSAVHSALAGAGLAGEVVVATDVEAAFAAAFPEGPGVLLIAGTGSIGWGRDAEGRDHRVGGWGTHLGDEGSGWWIGAAALRATVRYADGRWPAAKAVSDGVLSALGLPSAESLVAWFGTAGKGEVAALAPLVARLAAAGDDFAASILDRAADEVMVLTDALVRRCGSPSRNPPIALWGGLIYGPGGALHSRVRSRLRAAGWAAVDIDIDPPMGAARRALARLSAG